MKKNNSNKYLILILFSIFLFAFFHRFTSVANFTPIIAIALFLPRLTKNHYIQTLFPLTILISSDLIIGFHKTMLFTYGTIFLISFIGKALSNKNFKGLIYGSVFSVLLWHLIVNYGYHINSKAPLLESYLNAIPFDLRLLVSTFGFCSLFYYLEYINNKKFIKAPSLQNLKNLNF